MSLINKQALLRKLFPYEVVDKKSYAINAYAVEKTILDMPGKQFNGEAIEYLEDVLENLTAWKCHHEKLCNAIETLLEEIRDENRSD